MNKHLKNPNFYYIAVPVLVGLWAILVALVFYPKSVQAWEGEKSEFETTKKLIAQIVALQPKRLSYEVKDDKTEGDFDFPKTIHEFAQVFKIPDSNCSWTVRDKVKKAGKKTQSATVKIKNVDMQTMGRFVSGMLLRWPDLKCELIGLQKVGNSKNTWKVDLRFTYYY